MDSSIKTNRNQTMEEDSNNTSLIKVDFHAHTRFSIDSRTELSAFIQACERVGIDRIVVTDHNTIAGAKLAEQMAPNIVIVGEEIKTMQGELLAAFVTEEVPAGLDAERCVQVLREQGAFISVSHPFDWLRAGCWQRDALLEILPQVDAIEVFNARCMIPGANRSALRFALEHGIYGTAGSDAHTTHEIGRAFLVLPAFDDAAQLRDSLKQSRVVGTTSSIFVHMFSRFAKMNNRVSGKAP